MRWPVGFPFGEPSVSAGCPGLGEGLGQAALVGHPHRHAVVPLGPARHEGAWLAPGIGVVSFLVHTCLRVVSRPWVGRHFTLPWAGGLTRKEALAAGGAVWWRRGARWRDGGGLRRKTRRPSTRPGALGVVPPGRGRKRRPARPTWRRATVGGAQRARLGRTQGWGRPTAVALPRLMRRPPAAGGVRRRGLGRGGAGRASALGRHPPCHSTDDAPGRRLRAMPVFRPPGGLLLNSARLLAGPQKAKPPGRRSRHRPGGRLRRR